MVKFGSRRNTRPALDQTGQHGTGGHIPRQRGTTWADRRVLGVCLDCGECEQIHARGLGARCYWARKRAGTLDAFPALGRRSRNQLAPKTARYAKPRPRPRAERVAHVVPGLTRNGWGGWTTEAVVHVTNMGGRREWSRWYGLGLAGPSNHPDSPPAPAAYLCGLSPRLLSPRLPDLRARGLVIEATMGDVLRFGRGGFRIVAGGAPQGGNDGGHHRATSPRRAHVLEAVDPGTLTYGGAG